MIIYLLMLSFVDGKHDLSHAHVKIMGQCQVTICDWCLLFGTDMFSVFAKSSSCRNGEVVIIVRRI